MAKVKVLLIKNRRMMILKKLQIGFYTRSQIKRSRILQVEKRNRKKVEKASEKGIRNIKP